MSAEWTPLSEREPPTRIEIEYRTQLGNTLRGWLTSPGGDFWIDEFEHAVSRASVRDWREMRSPPTPAETINWTRNPSG